MKKETLYGTIPYWEAQVIKYEALVHSTTSWVQMDKYAAKLKAAKESLAELRNP